MNFKKIAVKVQLLAILYRQQEYRGLADDIGATETNTPFTRT